MTAPDSGALAANLVAFGRALRRAGLPVDPVQTRAFLQAVQLVGVARRADVKAAARATYVRRRDDLAVFDAVFDLFWRHSTAGPGGWDSLPRLRQAAAAATAPAAAPRGTPSAPAVLSHAGPAALPSARERLRRTDFADLTSEEARDAERMIAALRPRLPERPSRRYRAARSGRRLAARAMMRASLGSGGEPLDWRWWRPRTRRRPLVLICDISGSMAAYSRFLMRFAHACSRSGARVEVFVFATRLTRITRELAVRDPDAALRRLARRVADWSGGTRIGACLADFNRRWLRRTVRSGAVVLLVSDGWERDDPAVLSGAMATLRRSCHRLLWLDPLAGRPTFAPATAGLRAALPFIDALLPCGDLASLEDLAHRLARRSGGGALGASRP